MVFNLFPALGIIYPKHCWSKGIQNETVDFLRIIVKHTVAEGTATGLFLCHTQNNVLTLLSRVQCRATD